MKIVRVLGTLIILFTLAACNSATEPNDYAYVVAIGIDKAAADNQYEISVQFAKPAEISGGSSEDGGGGGETLGLITVEAPDIYSGINFANNLVSKKFRLSHTKIIVISKELAVEGISRFIYTIERSGDLRPNMYIAVSQGKASDFLASVKPEMEINPVKYYQLIFDNNYAEFVPKNTSQHTYFYMDSDERDIILPLVANSENDENESDEKGEKEEQNELLPSTSPVNYGGFEYLLREYIAGNISESKKNKAEAMGMAIFSGENMIGEMNGIEGELYNMISGSFRYSYNTFYCNSANDTVVMLVQKYKNPKIKVDTSGDNPKISVKLSFEGGIISAADDDFIMRDTYLYADELEEYIKEAVEIFLKKTSRELGADIVGFGAYAKRRFLTTDDFKEYNWREKYKNAEFDVEVDMRITRTGAVIKNNGGQ